MRDILSKSDIKVIIDEFYGKAKIDMIIGPVFHAAIDEEKWNTHVDRIYLFWEMILLGTSVYRGNPFMKHVDLPLTKVHFDRWIEIFGQTLDHNFLGPNVEMLKDRALKMSLMFQAKLKHKNENKGYRPIL